MYNIKPYAPACELILSVGRRSTGIMCLNSASYEVTQGIEMPTPPFFVPQSPGESDETCYTALAAFAQRPVPPLSERVYAIAYTHNGEHWVSTVGETSRGTRTVGRGKKARTKPIADGSTILAIFPGNPYMVVTDKGLMRPVASDWANPVMIGPDSISSAVLFSQ
jgi:hypothetical protein